MLRIRQLATLWTAICALAVSPALAGGQDCVAGRAISQDSTQAARARKHLREAGPEGLNAVLAAYDLELERSGIEPAEFISTPLGRRLVEAIDEIGGQRDCRYSRLYWYTDLDKAKAAAQADGSDGKAILSLRLLGKLTDEYSCANSRFFRTVLYADPEVSKVLRDRFVLHWKSVRPVPIVTIDFGDGRTIERTITGNSVHHVLDPAGRMIDAIPGLYGPKAFIEALAHAEEIATKCSGLSEVRRAAALRKYHARRESEILLNWQSDLTAVGFETEVKPTVLITAAGKSSRKGQPTAIEAAPAAMTKAFVEMPMLKAMAPDSRSLERAANDEIWTKIAALHAPPTRLSRASKQLMRQHQAKRASALSKCKRAVEDPLLRVVANFEESIALDTVRNEYLLHRQIHEWLNAQPVVHDVDAFNERVYAELFLTPSSDPWLGLVPPDTYVALENEGMVAP